tara:strand:+ start:323 stop:1315 length:993 start_codon:yes stop_codon:yes gene_type:complete
MAYRRPIKWNYTDNVFQEWTNAEVGALRYNLAVAYGDYLNAGGIGSVGAVSTGTGKADIYNPGGSGVVDTRRNQQSNSNTAGGPDYGSGKFGVGAAGSDEDWPAYPSTTISTISTTRWQQNLDATSMPSAQTLTDHSYLHYKGSGYEFQYTNAEQDFIDTILTDVISEMRSSHGVGTYYVSTTTPNFLGSGTWTDKGIVFTDTTYSAGSTIYRLYLKRNVTDTSPYAPSFPTSHRWVVGGSQGFHPQDIGVNSTLIQNVLMPVLKRNMSGSGALQYEVSTTNNGLNRGSMIDKRQEGSSTSQIYTDPNYISTRTPSGGASSITTYYFKLI